MPTNFYKNTGNLLKYPINAFSKAADKVGFHNTAKSFKNVGKSMKNTASRAATYLTGVRGGKRKTRKTKKSNRTTRKNRK